MSDDEGVISFQGCIDTTPAEVTPSTGQRDSGHLAVPDGHPDAVLEVCRISKSGLTRCENQVRKGRMCASA